MNTLALAEVVVWPVRHRSGVWAVVAPQSPPRIRQSASSTVVPTLPSSPSAKRPTKIAATIARMPAYSDVARPRSLLRLRHAMARKVGSAGARRERPRTQLRACPWSHVGVGPAHAVSPSAGGVAPPDVNGGWVGWRGAGRIGEVVELGPP